MPHKENGHLFSFVDHSCQLCEIGHDVYLSRGKPVCREAASPTDGIAGSALARYDTTIRYELGAQILLGRDDHAGSWSY